MQRFSKRQLLIAAELAKQHHESIDRLPYTAAMDELYAQFTYKIGQTYTKNLFWMIMLSARKRGLIGARKRQNR